MGILVGVKESHPPRKAASVEPLSILIEIFLEYIIVILSWCSFPLSRR